MTHSHRHSLSSSDLAFKRQFVSNEIAVGNFHHIDHIRLAYIFLVECDLEEAYCAMRRALLGFLEANQINTTKYHETMTKAWLLAVEHFMRQAEHCESAQVFIEKKPILLDTKIMLSHYSKSLLFSQDARESFVEPDLQNIPRYKRD